MQDYCMEGYLLLLPNIKAYVYQSQIQDELSHIAIETGRHAKPKIAKVERKCRYRTAI